MAHLNITGSPLLTFTFDTLPSWNKVLEVRSRTTHGYGLSSESTKVWRTAGYDAVLDYAREHGLEVENREIPTKHRVRVGERTKVYKTGKRAGRPMIKNGRIQTTPVYRVEQGSVRRRMLKEHLSPCKVMIVCRSWRRNHQRYDVHNLCLKAVVDGFTLAGLWRDDDSTCVPVAVYQHMGIDAENPRVEISIYALDE